MNWWSRLLDIISPRLCVVCGRRLSPAERSLCAVCQLHLPRTYFHHTPYDSPMAQLFWHLTPVQRAAAFIFYQPHSEMARMVYQMKYGNSPDVGEDLGRLMAADMQQTGYFEGIDVLVPVPLTGKRQRKRGYNQSEMLALGISSVTHIPIETKALQRLSFGVSQTRLGRRERQQNVDSVFEVSRPQLLSGRHILLIDDICTTGATLTACAQALRSVDGIRISILTLGFTKS